MYDVELGDRPCEQLAPVRAAPAASCAEDEVRRARAALERAWRTGDPRLRAARLNECSVRLRRGADAVPGAVRRELEWAELSARCLARIVGAGRG